ncbi:MAG: hypothetical protein L6R39_000951 [Caloplaca ligustica]|nr:MAG: hypothetical protein L6R39_000951 [Caloplaca ligustica]
MSAHGDERWRTPRGQQSASDQNHNPNQSRPFKPLRDISHGSVPSRNALDPGGPGLTIMSGNAFNNDQGDREASHQASAQEQSTPVNAFNAQEARKMLKNG